MEGTVVDTKRKSEDAQHSSTDNTVVKPAPKKSKTVPIVTTSPETSGEKRLTRSASRIAKGEEVKPRKYREADEEEEEVEEEEEAPTKEEEKEPFTLKTGDDAPDFKLTSDDGTTQVSLSDFKGKKVIVYFYPRADTPGCTKQACGIRDSEDLKTGSVPVLAISPDKADKLAKFRTKHTLTNITLLSDLDHKTAEAYGAYGKNRGRMGIIRSHFAIDGEGKITEAKYKVKPETTVELAVSLTKN